MDHEKMPIGKYKGLLIKNLDEDYVKHFITKKSYKSNKKLKEIFKKHHKDIINNQKGGDYIDDRLAAIKSELRKGDLDNKSTVTSGGAKKKKKRTKKKSKRTKKKSRKIKKKSKRTKKVSKKVPASKCKLLYFTMNGCPYCNEFNPVWDDLIELIPKLKTEKIERFENPEMIQEFDIKSFPNIILIKNNNKELYEGHRDTDNLMGFLKSNITNMV